MAEEDVAVEEVQASADEPQIEEAALPDAEAFVAEVAPDVEAPVGEDALEAPVAEAADTDSIAELPVELTRAEILERYGDVFADERNKARQAREAELRRESATREQTQRLVADMKRKIAEAPDGDLDSLNFVYDNAAGNAQVELMKTIAKQAVTSWAPGEEQQRALFATIESTSPEAIQTYAAELVNIASKAIGHQDAFALSIDDIPADSALAQSVLAREKSRVEAARKAALLESRPVKEPAPDIGVGGVVGSGDPLPDPSSSWGAASAAFNSERITSEQYSELAKKFGVRLS